MHILRFKKLKSKVFLLLLFTFYFLFFGGASAQQQFQLPPGEPLTYTRITNLLDATARFLYTAGITLAVITLVVSGIMYFMAGSDTEAKKAKGWFRNGIIGTFIILAIGVIIKTIEVIIRGRFF